jgi:dihydroorotase
VGLDARNLASCCCQRIGDAIATRLAAFSSLFPKVFKNLAQKKGQLTLNRRKNRISSQISDERQKINAYFSKISRKMRCKS